jgi:hypothetical protein
MFEVGDMVKVISSCSNRQKSYMNQVGKIIEVKSVSYKIKFDDGYVILFNKSRVELVTSAVKATGTRALLAPIRTISLNELASSYNGWSSDTKKETKHKEGCCPACGEAGRYINLAPVCSKHGMY